MTDAKGIYTPMVSDYKLSKYGGKYVRDPLSTGPLLG